MGAGDAPHGPKRISEGDLGELAPSINNRFVSSVSSWPDARPGMSPPPDRAS
jgi:hypothetical protein